MSRLLIGAKLVEPATLVAMSDDEWRVRQHDWSVVEDDRLYFRCDGVVYEATFVMETRLTDLVMQAFSNGRINLALDGKTADFLRSEDQERFQNRINREKNA